jgi:fumarate hydratase class II
MPGKVNPVLCESVIQVAAQVVGNDAAVCAAAAGGGQLQLNTAIPVIARNALESIQLLAASARLFSERCIEGLEVDRERAAGFVEGSLAMVTALVPEIGYDAAARIAKVALETGRTVREVCLAEGVLDEARLEALLDPGRQARGDA